MTVDVDQVRRPWTVGSLPQTPRSAWREPETVVEDEQEPDELRKPTTSGMKRSEDMHADHQARMLANPMRVACLCGWSWEGTAGEALERSRAHRAEAHPDLRPVRRSRRRAAMTLQGSGDKIADTGLHFRGRFRDPEIVAQAEAIAEQRREAALAADGRDDHQDEVI